MKRKLNNSDPEDVYLLNRLVCTYIFGYFKEAELEIVKSFSIKNVPNLARATLAQIETEYEVEIFDLNEQILWLHRLYTASDEWKIRLLQQTA